MLFAGIVLVLALVTRPIVQIAIALWMSVWIVKYAGIPSKIYGRMLSVAIGFWLTSIPALLIAGVTLSEQSQIQADVVSGWSIDSYYLYLTQQGVLQAGLKPELLLLDEPTAYLDPLHTRALAQTLETIHATGTTIVIATHDLE